ncbi:MAG: SGNH/GDSL hydrolase family protein [Chloroflexi bacterium]|nr:SGNH/GDSL hydrolase family protein [Chloroflexota bacterium]
MTRAAIVMALLGLALAGAVIEGGLRLYAELRAPRFVGAAIPTDDTVSDPLLVAWFKPNYVSPGGSPAFDASGFRIDGAPRPATPEPLDAMVGGSTAYGWDASDDQTIPAYLEQGLRSGGQPNAVMLNAGYPGLTSLDTLLVYQAKLTQLHPKTVVLLAGLNDIYYATDWIPENRLHWSSRTYEVGLRARHEPALRPLVDAINRYALNNCYTCYALGASLSGLYDRTQLLPMLNTAALFGQEPLAGDNARAMQLTGWMIGELGRRVHADGGCLIVAWQPIAGVPSGASTPSEARAVSIISQRAPTWSAVAPRMFSELRDAASAYFSSRLAVEVDATRVFDGVSDNVYQDDGVHYTALGNRLVAQAIQPALAQPSCAS